MKKWLGNGVLIAIGLSIAACWLIGAYFWSYSVDIELLEETPAEAADFVAYAKSGPLETYDTGLADYCFWDENGRFIVYLWFNAGYHPTKLRAEAGISVDIGWEKGAEAEQPLLYRITASSNAEGTVDYREDGYRTSPRNYNTYLLSLEK